VTSPKHENKNARPGQVPGAREEEIKMKLLRNMKKGQALVEYALVLALIAIVAILVVRAVGTRTTSTFDNIQNQMQTQGVTTTAPTSPQ
jgi:Flp pilus assembly pilin Flp